MKRGYEKSFRHRGSPWARLPLAYLPGSSRIPSHPLPSPLKIRYNSGYFKPCTRKTFLTKDKQRIKSFSPFPSPNIFGSLSSYIYTFIYIYIYRPKSVSRTVHCINCHYVVPLARSSKKEVFHVTYSLRGDAKSDFILALVYLSREAVYPPVPWKTWYNEMGKTGYNRWSSSGYISGDVLTVSSSFYPLAPVWSRYNMARSTRVILLLDPPEPFFLSPGCTKSSSSSLGRLRYHPHLAPLSLFSCQPQVGDWKWKIRSHKP